MKSKLAVAAIGSLAALLLGGCGSGLRNTGPADAPYLVPANPLWASDPGIGPPRITGTDTTDNALIVQWEETGQTPEGYRIFLDGTGAHSTFFDVDIPSGWFNARKVLIPTVSASGVARSGVGVIETVLLTPGATHEVTVWAKRGNFISGSGPDSSAVLQLSSPTITIGDATNNTTVQPVARQAFAIWDEDGDGIVNGEPGPGVAFPRGPGNVGGATAVIRGNAFDSSQGVGRANVVVGYFFDEELAPGSFAARFVAFHMLIDDDNNVTPVSVLYGDAVEGAGGRVWVSPPGTVILQSIRVTNGAPIVRTPNIVEGLVTAGTLASDGTTRVAEFSFRLALDPR